MTRMQMEFPQFLMTEDDLVEIALCLGARSVPGWSGDEERRVRTRPSCPESVVRDFRRAIRLGEDPLGDWFCKVRSAQERRKQGATYTPHRIVRAMFNWAVAQGAPQRVVDPGTGSGRFIVEAGRRFRSAQLIGIELDPVAAILARGHLSAAGLARRACIMVGDYRELVLPGFQGKTLHIGNPPYVRHHDINTRWKEWLATEARSRGLHVSKLAGLHLHFFLAAAASGNAGDCGAFITSAEWLDVNYGKMLRELFLAELGGQRIVVLEPTARPFPDAATTGAITCFEMRSRPRSIFVQRAKTTDDLGRLNGGMKVRRERFEAENRWSHLTRRTRRPPDGYIELGEICRVHRGQVTGANRVWIAGDHSRELPESLLYPTVTRAQELYRAGKVLDDTSGLRRVIDIPADLSVLDVDTRKKVQGFLRTAKALGADRGYVAKNRKAWWCVGLREAAPILATYMARRPPAFVRNRANARNINISHGLYPRERLDEAVLLALVDYLSSSTSVSDGRTYAGGLTKFEPGEMERLFVPRPEVLAQGTG